MLLAAGDLFVLSVSLWFSGQEVEGEFVGLSVPSMEPLGCGDADGGCARWPLALDR